MNYEQEEDQDFLCNSGGLNKASPKAREVVPHITLNSPGNVYFIVL